MRPSDIGRSRGESPDARQRRYAQREADHLCHGCADPLPVGVMFKLCADCRTYKADIRRRQYHAAKAAAGTEGPGNSKWAAIDTAERCPVCSLLGDHVCLPKTTAEIVSSRRSA